MKNTIYILALCSFALSPIQVWAGNQTVSCTKITYNLRLTSSDRNTKNEVTCLQEFLIANDFLNATPSGYFGTKTQSALKEYQRSKGLSPVGNTGPLTRSYIALDITKLSSKVSTPIVTPRPTTVLSKINTPLNIGNQGLEVQKLHVFLDKKLGTQLLNTNGDVFNSKTQDTVKAFQQLTSIMPIDGVIAGTTLDQVNYEIELLINPTNTALRFDGAGQSSKASVMNTLTLDKVKIHNISSPKISFEKNSESTFLLTAEYQLHIENISNDSIQINMNTQHIPQSQAKFTDTNSKISYLPNRSQFSSVSTLGSDGVYVLKGKTADTFTVKYQVLSYLQDKVPQNTSSIPTSDIDRLPYSTYTFESPSILVNSMNILSKPISSGTITISK